MKSLSKSAKTQLGLLSGLPPSLHLFKRMAPGSFSLISRQVTDSTRRGLFIDIIHFLETFKEVNAASRGRVLGRIVFWAELGQTHHLGIAEVLQKPEGECEKVGGGDYA